MSTSVAGIVIGVLLALVAVVGGAGGFVLAVVLGALGWVVGAQVEGRVDLSALAGRRRG